MANTSDFKAKMNQIHIIHFLMGLCRLCHNAATYPARGAYTALHRRLPVFKRFSSKGRKGNENEGKRRGRKGKGERR